MQDETYKRVRRFMSLILNMYNIMFSLYKKSDRKLFTNKLKLLIKIRQILNHNILKNVWINIGQMLVVSY